MEGWGFGFRELKGLGVVRRGHAGRQSDCGEEAVPEPVGSRTENLVAPPRGQEGIQSAFWVVGVLYDGSRSPETTFPSMSSMAGSEAPASGSFHHHNASGSFHQPLQYLPI